MKQKLFLYFCCVLFVFLILYTCGGRPDNNGNTHGCSNDSTKTVIVASDSAQYTIPITYNIYIENSGSMKGYFSGNGSSDLETIINDYYDRLTTNKSNHVTLNYINTIIESFHGDKKDYLVKTKSKCTAKYSEIDSILRMSMESINNNNVNIVISDYCFEAKDGNLKTAQSEIEKLFAQQLDSNNDLSVAIRKYMVDFKGNYYPGGLKCNQLMPVYFWIFGNAKAVKSILDLKVKDKDCGNLLLQNAICKQCKVEMASKRAVKDDTIIIVKNWEKDRTHDSVNYTAIVVVDLDDVLLSDSDLMDPSNYSISNSSYTITSISKDSNGYKFTISTPRPSPGEIDITYMNELPVWVEKSNFEGVGLLHNSEQ